MIHGKPSTPIHSGAMVRATRTFKRTSAGPGTSFVARLNANITPTILNEFVASYTADHIFLTALPATGVDISLQGFQMGNLYNNGFDGKLPSFTIGIGYCLRRRILHGYRLLPLEERQPHLHLSRQPDQNLGQSHSLDGLLLRRRTEKPAKLCLHPGHSDL